jgi:hypothetical protein
LLDDAPHKCRRFRHVSALTGFHRAQQRGLQRRLVLFEVEGHLLVGHFPPQRKEQEPVRRGCEHDEHRDPGGDDRRAAEPRPLHAIGGKQEQPERNTHDRHRAS